MPWPLSLSLCSLMNPQGLVNPPLPLYPNICPCSNRIRSGLREISTRKCSCIDCTPRLTYSRPRKRKKGGFFSFFPQCTIALFAPLSTAKPNMCACVCVVGLQSWRIKDILLPRQGMRGGKYPAAISTMEAEYKRSANFFPPPKEA